MIDYQSYWLGLGVGVILGPILLFLFKEIASILQKRKLPRAKGEKL